MPIKLTTIAGARDAVLHIKTASGVVPAALWLKTESGVVLISGSGYDIYVDAISGSDANDGTTPGKAFATLAAAQTAAVAAGDGVKIGLARGSVWRESLQLTNLSNFTVSAYGSAELPRPTIDGADVITSWAKVAGYSNVYAITRTAPAASSSVHYSVLIKDGSAQYGARWLLERAYATSLAASLAALDAAPGSFLIMGPSTGAFSAGNTVTIYVHAEGSGDPNVSAEYMVPTRQYCILQSDAKTGAQIYGVSAVRQLHHDGSIKVGGNCILSDVVTAQGYIHNVFIGTGEYLDCTSDDALKGYNVVGHSVESPRGGLVMSGAHVTGYKIGPLYFAHGDGFNELSLIDSTARLEAVGNCMTLCAQQRTLVRGTVATCTVPGDGRYHDYSDEYLEGAGMLVHLRDTLRWGTMLYSRTSRGSKIFIYKSRAVIDWTSLVRMYQADASTEVHVIGCAIREIPYASFMIDSVAGGKLVIKHCIIDQNDCSTSKPFINGYSSSVVIESDHNVYWNRAGTPTWKRNGTNITTFDWWKSFGNDANSVVADPLWVSDPAATPAGDFALANWALQPSSPAIAVGAGPEHMPAGYTPPAWLPADIVAMLD